MSTFTGFRPEAIQFLADLAQNNDRAWFQPRKAEFDRLLKDAIAHCESVRDYVSRDLFADILESEEHHVDELEKQFAALGTHSVDSELESLKRERQLKPPSLPKELPAGQS